MVDEFREVEGKPNPTITEMKGQIREQHATAIKKLANLRAERALLNEQIADARSDEAEAGRLARALEPRKRKT